MGLPNSLSKELHKPKKGNPQRSPFRNPPTTKVVVPSPTEPPFACGGDGTPTFLRVRKKTWFAASIV